MEDEDYATTFAVEDHNWWFVGTREICLDLLDAGLGGRADARLLDVGCGTGITLRDLRGRGTAAVGLDASPLALGFCRRRGERHLVRGDGRRLPFPDGSFDAVTAIGVVEHLDDDAGALAEWARVLRPGGSLVLLTSAYRWLWSGHDVSNHHRRRYTAGQLRTLLHGAGLQPATVSYVNTVLFPGIAAVRGAQRVARRGADPAPHKDTGEVPAALNRLLLGVLRLERRAVRHRPLPFGVSIVARASRAPESR